MNATSRVHFYKSTEHKQRERRSLVAYSEKKESCKRLESFNEYWKRLKDNTGNFLQNLEKFYGNFGDLVIF